MGTLQSPLETIHITPFTTDDRLRLIGCHKYFYSVTIQRVTVHQTASHTKRCKTSQPKQGSMSKIREIDS
jgi:hypothetical protein